MSLTTFAELQTAIENWITDTTINARVLELKAGHDAAKDTYTKTATAGGLPVDQIFVNMPELKRMPKATTGLGGNNVSGGIKFLGYE